MKVDNFMVNHPTKEGDCCPECGAKWDGGDIYEHFLSAKFNPNHEQHGYYENKSINEILDTASSYGWSETNKVRFGRVIGVELLYDDPRHYDGVSFWKCPSCEIAWNRFTGERTTEFVSEPLNKDGGSDRKCIYRSLTTPDGTILVSHHRHDYVTHVDANGETYMLDGGPDNYYRSSINKVKGVMTEVYLDEGHEKIRDFVHRGGRGKNGDQPLTWVPVSQMNDNWIDATITYNDERGMGNGWFNQVLKEELKYRKLHNIIILE
jgi:hypothetical protein